MVPVPTGIRLYRRLLRYGREGNTDGSLRLQVSQAAVRRAAVGGPLGWGNQGVDTKHRGRRVRQRKAGLGRHESLCVHNTSVPSHG